MATLSLMVGLPAAGKTTHAKHLAVHLGALRRTPEEWMIPLYADNDADGKRDVLTERGRPARLHRGAGAAVGRRRGPGLRLWSREGR